MGDVFIVNFINYKQPALNLYIFNDTDTSSEASGLGWSIT